MTDLTIKAFNHPILPRLAWLHQIVFDTLPVFPSHESRRREFASVVGPYCGGLAVPEEYGLENPDDALAGARRIGLERRQLLGEVVLYDQELYWQTFRPSIPQEVHRPYLIALRHRRHWSTGDAKLSPSPALDLQPLFAIYAITAL